MEDILGKIKFVQHHYNIFHLKCVTNYLLIFKAVMSVFAAD